MTPMVTKKTPIDKAISKIGSARKLAKIIGVNSSHVSFWRYRAERNRGGIPEHYHHAILLYCKENNIKLKQKDLWFEIEL